MRVIGEGAVIAEYTNFLIFALKINLQGAANFFFFCAGRPRLRRRLRRCCRHHPRCRVLGRRRSQNDNLVDIWGQLRLVRLVKLDRDPLRVLSSVHRLSGACRVLDVLVKRDRDALQVGSLPEFLELFAPLHFVQQASDLRIAVCVLLKFVTFTRNTAA